MFVPDNVVYIANEQTTLYFIENIASFCGRMWNDNLLDNMRISFISRATLNGGGVRRLDWYTEKYRVISP